ncbi:MAG: aldose epimerase [Leptolyngbyaceae cyanobacterium SM2_5_2]|nr:aldose epimerase [Leptolyngbyaceae cyanobacterium SM2_5_2]
MATITVEARQYQTYVLSDETAQAQASVVPERGGILISWQIQGQEIFYLDTERFKDPTLSVRGGIPLLFPICGNLADDSYTLNGKTYALVQHGFARNLPWQATQQSSTTDGASLTVTLKSSDATREGYPVDFVLDYIYTLKGNTLELRQRHTNLSDVPMPFSTGIHPYFAVADKSKLTIELPSTQYQLKGEATLQPFGGTFDFEQDEIDFSFTNLTGQSATVIDEARQTKLTIGFDAHYSTLLFWTVKGKDFYCLEPWTGPRNAMNTGDHLLTVAPNDTLETVITMTAEVG